jgi:hypothetical protein
MDPITFCLIVGWLVAYRTTIGAYCVVADKETPWAKARTARTARRDASTTSPKRTARGFLGRLYGDMWEDLHDWREHARARRINDRLTGGRRPTLRERAARLMDLVRGTFRRPDNTEDEELGEEEPIQTPDVPTVETTPAVDDQAAPTSAGETTPTAPTPTAPNNTSPTSSQPSNGPADEELTDDVEAGSDFAQAPDLPPRSWCTWPTPSAELGQCGLRTDPGERFCPAHLRAIVETAKNFAETRAAPAPTGPVPIAGDTETNPPAPAFPAERPRLSVVPNPTPDPEPVPAGSVHNPDNGGNMTTPTQAPLTDDTPSVQNITQFADDVCKSGGEEWPATLENAETNVASAGLGGDPEIAAALGTIKESAAAMAAAGADLKQAMAKHVALAANVSDTQHVGTQIGAYQNQ